MQACWLALCGWLLGGLAQAAETIRYCDYPVYPPISWSDGPAGPGAGAGAGEAAVRRAGLPGRGGGAGQLAALPARRRRRTGRPDTGLPHARARSRPGVFRRAGAARGGGDLLQPPAAGAHPIPRRPRRLSRRAVVRRKLRGGLRPLRRPPRQRRMGFRQPTELRQAGAPAHRLHRPRTPHRHAVRRAPGRRREHPCAARTADGGLPAGGGLAALAAGGEDGRDRPGLRGYRDDGSIQRWLDDSVRDYRRLAGNRADAW